VAVDGRQGAAVDCRLTGVVYGIDESEGDPPRSRRKIQTLSLKLLCLGTSIVHDPPANVHRSTWWWCVHVHRIRFEERPARGVDGPELDGEPYPSNGSVENCTVGLSTHVIDRYDMSHLQRPPELLANARILATGNGAGSRLKDPAQAIPRMISGAPTRNTSARAISKLRRICPQSPRRSARAQGPPTTCEATRLARVPAHFPASWPWRAHCRHQGGEPRFRLTEYRLVVPEHRDDAHSGRHSAGAHHRAFSSFGRGEPASTRAM
jgi:hypothetical protein